jgi:hypothetical protein
VRAQHVRAWLWEREEWLQQDRVGTWWRVLDPEALNVTLLLCLTWRRPDQAGTGLGSGFPGDGTL